MAKKYFTIQVSKIYGDYKCRKYDVEFEKPAKCAKIRCVYQNENEILVEIPDGCDECIYAIIRCVDDDCYFCDEPKRIKICPCVDNRDCADCELCIDGLCESICREGEFCKDGTCLECDDTHPCPNGKVCVGGKCRCPKDKPHENSKGECVACLEDEHCPPCFVCIGGGCVPVDCPDGVCDPKSGKCVDCINSGDCTGANECCLENTCVCCDGFVRDPVTGECRPEDECIGDDDCKDCEICYKGKCIPRDCPDGYICVDDDCKKICDCQKGDCPKGSVCVEGREGCYCFECTGDCETSGDCDQYCECVDGKCVPKKCIGTCHNGLDCGEGCGCLDGECVSCESLDCDTCKRALGCECIGGKCMESICEGDCVMSSDCGDGCTCYEGECVPCSAFACDECDSIDGCKCVDGTCEDDGDGGCNDQLVINKKDDTCDLEGVLTKETKCTCSPLTVLGKARSITSGNVLMFDYEVQLRKGKATSYNHAKLLPLLGDTSVDTIAENEEPTSGIISVITEIFTLEDGTWVQFSGGSISMQNKDSAAISGLKLPVPGTVVSGLTVVKARIVVELISDLKFANDCVYKAVAKIGEKTFTSAGELSNPSDEKILGMYGVIKSDSYRLPMFVWYRSKDGTYGSSAAFRKVYVPGSGVYKDVLHGPADAPDAKYPLVPFEGELWSGYSYALKTDCSCDRDFDLGKLVFCNPSEFLYQIKDCGRKVELLPPFEPCDVNKDIRLYESAGYDIPDDAQVKYEFYINGQLVATFRHDKDLGMIKDGTTSSMFDTYSIGQVIRELRMKINHDDKGECDIVYSVQPQGDYELNYTIECVGTLNQYDIKVPITQSFGQIVSVDSISSYILNVTQSGGYWIITVQKGVPVNISFITDTGCVLEETFNENCCDGFSVQLNHNSPCADDDLVLSYTVLSGGTPNTTAVFTLPDGSTQSGTTVTIQNPQSGFYHVEVTDEAGCKATDSKYVSVGGNIDYQIQVGKTTLCQGDTTEIIFTSTNGIGGTVYYSVNGVDTSFVVPNTGQFVIGPISTSAVYVFDRIEKDGCTKQIDETITIEVVPSTTLQITPSATTICQGDWVDFSITGGVQGCIVNAKTGNAIVGTTVLDSNGEGTISLQPSQTTSYTFELGQCDGCVNFSGYNVIINVQQGQTPNLVSESCDASLTNKTMEFDCITSAFDQNNNPLTISGNTITVNVNLVSQVTVCCDNGSCETCRDFLVGVCECPPFNIILDDQTINQGQCATLAPAVSGGGGGPYTYSWSTGDTTSSITVCPTATTTYWVDVTSQVTGCTERKYVTVVVVKCEGGIDDIVHENCWCDASSCVFNLRMVLIEDFQNCTPDTAASTVTAYVDGVQYPASIIKWNNTAYIRIFNVPCCAPCPDPNQIQVSGTLVTADDNGTGLACCNGVSIPFNFTIPRPGGGWNCGCP